MKKLKYIKLFEESDHDFSNSERVVEIIAEFHRIAKNNDNIRSIVDMISNGEIDEVESYRGSVDSLYRLALDYDRYDIADLLKQSGYYIKDIDEVSKWFKYGKKGELSKLEDDERIKELEKWTN